jgi:hypothetical protein
MLDEPSLKLDSLLPLTPFATMGCGQTVLRAFLLTREGVHSSGNTNEQSPSRRPTSKHGLGGVGQVVEMGREQFEVLAAPFGRRKQALLSQLGRHSSFAALALPLLMSYLLVQGVREVRGFLGVTCSTRGYAADGHGAGSRLSRCRRAWSAPQCDKTPHSQEDKRASCVHSMSSV